MSTSFETEEKVQHVKHNGYGNGNIVWLSQASEATLGSMARYIGRICWHSLHSTIKTGSTWRSSRPFRILLINKTYKTLHKQTRPCFILFHLLCVLRSLKCYRHGQNQTWASLMGYITIDTSSQYRLIEHLHNSRIPFLTVMMYKCGPNKTKSSKYMKYNQLRRSSKVSIAEVINYNKLTPTQAVPVIHRSSKTIPVQLTATKGIVYRRYKPEFQTDNYGICKLLYCVKYHINS